MSEPRGHTFALPDACACGNPVSVVATEVCGGAIYVNAGCGSCVFDGCVDAPFTASEPSLAYVR